jgi:hypothetical protein
LEENLPSSLLSVNPFKIQRSLLKESDGLIVVASSSHICLEVTPRLEFHCQGVSNLSVLHEQVEAKRQRGVECRPQLLGNSQRADRIIQPTGGRYPFEFAP